MLIARVIGTTVSTIKDEKLSGRKLLILRQTDERGNPVGKPYVAVVMAVVMPTKPATEPTERSICPMTITITMPIARMST